MRLHAIIATRLARRIESVANHLQSWQEPWQKELREVTGELEGLAAMIDAEEDARKDDYHAALRSHGVDI